VIGTIITRIKREFAIYLQHLARPLTRVVYTQAVATTTVTLCELGLFYAPVAFASASLTLRAE
jgi:hypothetical protein